MRSTPTHRRSSVQAAAIAITVLATNAQLSGCVANTAKRDFYAMRSVRVHSQEAEPVTIVRTDPTDLLTRERRAMALVPTE